MSVGAINSSGTVIGSIPVDGSGNESNQPYLLTTIGYAVRSSNGQYSPFVPLLPPSE